MNSLYHEQLYRTPALMARFGEFPVAVCGAGALGGNIAESLARMGFGKLRLVDRDRVEERNLSTQPYYCRTWARPRRGCSGTLCIARSASKWRREASS